MHIHIMTSVSTLNASWLFSRTYVIGVVVCFGARIRSDAAWGVV